MSRIAELRRSDKATWIVAATVLLALALFPLFRSPLDSFVNDMILALAYVVMALGLNLVVGFAGLLDLGFVAFYAFGALVAGWWASAHFSTVNENADPPGIHVGVSEFVGNLPGIHLNFLLLIIGAVLICAIAGALIGLPTLRLRGDYIAIVTLAFGEIIGRVAANGDELTFFGDNKFSNGRQSISPIDQINLPFIDEYDQAFNLRPYYWTVLVLVLVVLFVNFRLRDSRLGRAWIALREDEVAAASMGVPLVKTKLLAYAAGGAFGGISGVFLGSFYNSVNANLFQFGFSIFILAMVILGGLGSIWGVAIGAMVLGLVNHWFIPDVMDGETVRGWVEDVGLEFTFGEVKFGIFGFILLLMMVLRPQGLLPERRREAELKQALGDESIYEARA